MTHVGKGVPGDERMCRARCGSGHCNRGPPSPVYTHTLPYEGSGNIDIPVNYVLLEYYYNSCCVHVSVCPCVIHLPED